jgi:LDH2 family malate/lactate/ureidoglycolate dehydrogenase
VGKGIGHFFGAMEIAGFMDPDEFKSRVDEWIDVFRGTKPAAGRAAVLIPGDPEHEEEKKRQLNGIPLIDAVIKDLQDISRRTGIPLE